jgi:hypothetical protein
MNADKQRVQDSFPPTVIKIKFYLVVGLVVTIVTGIILTV